jgi:hypothetical protein
MHGDGYAGRFYVLFLFLISHLVPKLIFFCYGGSPPLCCKFPAGCMGCAEGSSSANAVHHFGLGNCAHPM